MKIHRFYCGAIELEHDFWVDDPRLFHQWSRVLRFQPGQQLTLFNDQKVEKQYEVMKLGADAIHVKLVTEIVVQIPKKDVYLCFSLLKKDKNEWVLQKATELGVRHFVPIVSDRTEKTGFDMERALKIVIEAAEQCGRADIPRVREPITLDTALKELTPMTELYIAEQHSNAQSPAPDLQSVAAKAIAVFIGPEGGWSDAEKELFTRDNIHHLNLSSFTLRAETACITAVAILTQ